MSDFVLAKPEDFFSDEKCPALGLIQYDVPRVPPLHGSNYSTILAQAKSKDAHFVHKHIKTRVVKVRMTETRTYDNVHFILEDILTLLQEWRARCQRKDLQFLLIPTLKFQHSSANSQDLPALAFGRLFKELDEFDKLFQEFMIMKRQVLSILARWLGKTMDQTRQLPLEILEIIWQNVQLHNWQRNVKIDIAVHEDPCKHGLETELVTGYFAALGSLFKLLTDLLFNAEKHGEVEQVVSSLNSCLQEISKARLKLYRLVCPDLVDMQAIQKFANYSVTMNKVLPPFQPDESCDFWHDAFVPLVGNNSDLVPFFFDHGITTTAVLWSLSGQQRIASINIWSKYFATTQQHVEMVKSEEFVKGQEKTLVLTSDETFCLINYQVLSTSKVYLTMVAWDTSVDLSGEVLEMEDARFSIFRTINAIQGRVRDLRFDLVKLEDNSEVLAIVLQNDASLRIMHFNAKSGKQEKLLQSTVTGKLQALKDNVAVFSRDCQDKFVVFNSFLTSANPGILSRFDISSGILIAPDIIARAPNPLQVLIDVASSYKLCAVVYEYRGKIFCKIHDYGIKQDKATFKLSNKRNSLGNFVLKNGILYFTESDHEKVSIWKISSGLATPTLIASLLKVGTDPKYLNQYPDSDLQSMVMPGMSLQGFEKNHDRIRSNVISRHWGITESWFKNSILKVGKDGKLCLVFPGGYLEIKEMTSDDAFMDDKGKRLLDLKAAESKWRMFWDQVDKVQMRKTSVPGTRYDCDNDHFRYDEGERFGFP